MWNGTLGLSTRSSVVLQWLFIDYDGNKAAGQKVLPGFIVTRSFQIDDIAVTVVFKNIRRINLRVCPPEGEVRVSAPLRAPMALIREFVESKLRWIRRQQELMRIHSQQLVCNYEDGERHSVWGRCYRLQLRERQGRPYVETQNGSVLMCVPPGTDRTQRRIIMEKWYCKLVAEEAPPLIARWEPVIGVEVFRISVRWMKSRWGSCSIRTRGISLNAELAKRSPSCLEYIVVHEMSHLLEPSHNFRFRGLMDRFMPAWRDVRTELKKSILAIDRPGAIDSIYDKSN